MAKAFWLKCGTQDLYWDTEVLLQCIGKSLGHRHDAQAAAGKGSQQSDIRPTQTSFAVKDDSHPSIRHSLHHRQNQP
ncbi:hypothetical protein D3C84_1171990 [compost metagenome]